MKLKYITSKIGLLVTFCGFLALSSCKDDFPTALDTESKVTVLNTIKIINAGENGDVVMEGVVDEYNKTVSFLRIDTLTDFSNLQFEASVSDGAKLDKEVYPVTFEEGQSEKVIVVKVESSPRYREYLVKLRLKVPVYGADFETYETYDFTNNPLGSPLYPSFGGLATRGTGFDGEKVLIVSRKAGEEPHLLNVSDLKNGVTTKIPINLTGVAGGTYPYNMGAQVNGHTYLASLSTSPTNPLKVYHWTDPNATADVILDVTTGGISGAGARNGDNFSVSLNDQGDGYLFFGDNPGQIILRYDVSNYTTVSNPTTFPAPYLAGTYGTWTNYNRIGNTSEYLFSGVDVPIVLVSEGGAADFTMKTATLPIRAVSPRIVYFNGERYLTFITANRNAATGDVTNFYVYDITQGKTVKEALTIFENRPSNTPVFEYSLQGPPNGAPSSQTGFYVKKDVDGKDESLMLYAAQTDAGFVIFEFGKKVALDD